MFRTYHIPIATNDTTYHMFRANSNITLEQMSLFLDLTNNLSKTFETFQEKTALPKLGSWCLPVLLRLGSLGPEVFLFARKFHGEHMYASIKKVVFKMNILSTEYELTNSMYHHFGKHSFTLFLKFVMKKQIM